MYSTEEIINKINQLKKQGETFIDLSKKSLGDKNAEELATALSTLHGSGITDLDLSDNGLGRKSASELTTILRAPQGSGITYLNLSWNALGDKSNDELITMFSALHDLGVPHLDLSSNRFGDKSGNELAMMLRILHGSAITHLDFGCNGLEDKNVEELITIFTAIPATIISASFSLEELEKMGIEKRRVLQQRFPNAEHVFLIDSNGKPIPLRSIRGANFYRNFGFITPIPSLANVSAFFIHNNRRAFTEQQLNRLTSDANTIVKQVAKWSDEGI